MKFDDLISRWWIRQLEKELFVFIEYTYDNLSL